MNATMARDERFSGNRHGAGTTLILHLAPGVLVAATALLLSRMAADRDLPPALGLQGAALLVLASVLLGTIALATRLRTGSWRLRGALRYTARLPRRRLLLLGTATLTWAGIVFALIGPSAETIRASLFAQWPTELDSAGHLTNPDAYPQQMLVAAWISVEASQAEGMLEVGDGQRISWTVAGNPAGQPAVALCGGPGRGTGPLYASLFDLERYRVVLFDQRG